MDTPKPLYGSKKKGAEYQNKGFQRLHESLLAAYTKIPELTSTTSKLETRIMMLEGKKKLGANKEPESKKGSDLPPNWTVS